MLKDDEDFEREGFTEEIRQLEAEVERLNQMVLYWEEEAADFRRQRDAKSDEIEQLRAEVERLRVEIEHRFAWDWLEDALRMAKDECMSLRDERTKLIEAGSALYFVVEGYAKRGEMQRIQWRALDERWRAALATARPEGQVESKSEESKSRKSAS